MSTEDEVLHVRRGDLRAMLERAGDMGQSNQIPEDVAADFILKNSESLWQQGYVKLPAEWYIEPDGDDDPVIWTGADELIGYRFMAGNADIGKPVADWLWENIRKGES